MSLETEGEEVRKGKGTGVAQAVSAGGALQPHSETRRLFLKFRVMFLVQSYKMVTAWEVTPLQENCNLDKIYRKTVPDLRIAWFEARHEAQMTLVQCDANIVHVKQERQQLQRIAGIIRLSERNT